MTSAVRVSIPQAVWIACNHGISVQIYGLGECFNTASGMDCMQSEDVDADAKIIFVFQYRKRYGLHAIKGVAHRHCGACGFNTASGMDCMQCRFVLMFDPLLVKFQYRKRYGLHAIPSLTALGTAEPRSGFSKRIALLDKSPQPRGIFLSPKSAENVRKPCDTKETFVHGKNLKLMAFSPKFFPSL